MSNDINVNMKPHPTDVTVDGDSLSLTLSDNSVFDVGRMSGYSDNELVNPIINDDGYFQWFNPELDLIGETLIKQNITVDHVVSTVKQLGFYEGTEDVGFLKNRLFPNNSFVLNGEYVGLIDAVKYDERMEIETESGVRCFVSDLDSGPDRLANIFNENGHFGIHVGTSTGAFVQIEFPSPVNVDGIVIARNTSYGTRVKREVMTSLDGVNWDETIVVDALLKNDTKFSDFVLDPNLEEEDAEEGVLFFETPRNCKFIKIKNPDNQTSYNTLNYVMPFSNIKEVVNLRNHKYTDIQLDDEVFDLVETEESLELSLKQIDINHDISNSKSLERQLCLQGSETQLIKYESTLTFPEPLEFAPGVSSTISYSYIAGAIELEAGTYELELELEHYSYDYRIIDKDGNNHQIRTWLNIGVLDPIQRYELCPRQVLVSTPFELDANQIEITIDNMYTTYDVNFLLLNSNPTTATTIHSKKSNDSYLEIFFNYKELLSHDGFVVQLGYNNTGARFIDIEYSNDSGSTWIPLISNYETGGVNSSWVEILFDNPVIATNFKIIAKLVKEGVYTSSVHCNLGRLLPIFTKDENLPVKKSVLNFSFYLGSKSNIMLDAITDSESLIRDRKLKINKISDGGIAEVYKVPEVEHTVLDPLILKDDTNSDCINKPGGTATALDFSTGEELAVTFPSAVKLNRIGLSTKLGNIGDFKLEKLEGDYIDKSDLLFNPILPDPEESIIEYNYSGPVEFTPGISAHIYNLKNIFDGRNDTYMYTSSTGNRTVYLDYSENITPDGWFYTLNAGSFMFAGRWNSHPLDYLVECWNDSSGTWEEISHLELTEDGVNQQPKEADAIRRFIKFPIKPTSNKFKITLSIGLPSKQVASLRELGLYSNPNNVDLSTFKNTNEYFDLGNEIRPFSNVIPAGTYRFTALAPRTDSAWYIEPADIGE